MVDRLRKRLVSQDTYILNSERNLRRLLAMSTKIGADITGRRDRLAKLIAASRKRQDELVAEKKDVVDKILKKSKSLKTESKNKSTTIKKLKVFFVKKHKVEKLISEVNQQHDKLRHDLTMLVKKAQVYDVYMKSKKHGRGVNELKTAFGTIDTRKKWLERKIKDLSKAFTDLTK